MSDTPQQSRMRTHAAVDFATVLGAVGKEHAMQTRWRPPHQQVRCAGKHIFWQDDWFCFALQTSTEMLQKALCKQLSGAELWRLRSVPFAQNVVNGYELFTVGNLILVDEQSLLQNEFTPAPDFRSHLHFLTPGQIVPNR